MNKNEPAFPNVQTEIAYNSESNSYMPITCSCGGLTKREWYAGMAMQGMLADPDVGNMSSKSIASSAFCIADSMIAESERNDES